MLFDIKRLIYVPVILTAVLFSSCTKEEDCPEEPVQKDSLILHFEAFGGGDTLEYQKFFTDPLGRPMKIEQLLHYVSNIYLLNGSKETFVKDVDLIIYEDKGEIDPGNEKQKIRLLVPRGNYTGIRFVIGLDSATNAGDPSSYEESHPLSVYQNTYWSAWDKYRFIMIEGFMDADNDGINDDVFGIHTGFDVCYRIKTFDHTIEIKENQTTQLYFNIEVNEMFFGPDTLDPAIEPFWHGEPELVDRAIRLSDNFIYALELK